MADLYTLFHLLFSTWRHGLHTWNSIASLTEMSSNTNYWSKCVNLCNPFLLTFFFPPPLFFACLASKKPHYIRSSTNLRSINVNQILKSLNWAPFLELFQLKHPNQNSSELSFICSASMQEPEKTFCLSWKLYEFYNIWKELRKEQEKIFSSKKENGSFWTCTRQGHSSCWRRYPLNFWS